MCGPDSLFLPLAHAGMGWWLSAESLCGSHPQLNPPWCPLRGAALIAWLQYKSPASWPPTGIYELCQVQNAPWDCLSLLLTALPFTFHLPNPGFFSLRSFLSTSPFNLLHTNFKRMISWTWPITRPFHFSWRSVPISFNFLYLLFSVFAWTALYLPFLMSVFSKQSHMYWLLEVLLEEGKSLFLFKKSFHFIFFTDAFLAKPNSNCPQPLNLTNWTINLVILSLPIKFQL